MEATLNATSITASLNENSQAISLGGTLSSDGNSANGSYTAAAGGCTNGDAGTFVGTRSGIGEQSWRDACGDVHDYRHSNFRRHLALHFSDAYRYVIIQVCFDLGE
ncbi:MAG TPA: hypothetical protein VGP19_10240 [Candidatus Acidoferrales bacterium]|jgi:hypothetical protein|nr:hypothetical protein [Candidatus Acidoferrales bacterium]